MYNISFMGVDEADKLQEQGLPAFAEMAVKHSCGRWSELDAEVYYNKIMTEAGLPTEALLVKPKEDAGSGENSGTKVTPKSTTGGSKGSNTGK